MYWHIRKHCDICSIDTSALEKVYYKADSQRRLSLTKCVLGEAIQMMRLSNGTPVTLVNALCVNNLTPECIGCSSVHILRSCGNINIYIYIDIPDISTCAAQQRDAFWYHGLLPLPDG